MARKRLTYREGDLFAVPLGSGGYAVGLAARLDKKGVVLGYFFGPVHQDLPLPMELSSLTRVNAAYVTCFGDLALIRGTWPVLGSLPGWRRTEWPMTAFGRREELTGRFFRVEYSDDDPNSQPRETRISEDEWAQLPEDGLAGFGFVEDRLTQILKGTQPVSQGHSAMPHSGPPPGESAETGAMGVSHYLYFRDQRTATKVARRLRAAAYVVEVRESPRGWLVRPSHVIPKGQEALEAAAWSLEVIATSEGGEYDGWERERSS